MSAEEIGKKFEKEFGTKSDYFNHRGGLFEEIKQWVVTESEAYHKSKVDSELAEDLIHNLKKANYPKEYIEGVLHAKRILNQN